MMEVSEVKSCKILSGIESVILVKMSQTRSEAKDRYRIILPGISSLFRGLVLKFDGARYQNRW